MRCRGSGYFERFALRIPELICKDATLISSWLSCFFLFDIQPLTTHSSLLLFLSSCFVTLFVLHFKAFAIFPLLSITFSRALRSGRSLSHPCKEGNPILQRLSLNFIQFHFVSSRIFTTFMMQIGFSLLFLFDVIVHRIAVSSKAEKWRETDKEGEK